MFRDLRVRSSGATLETVRHLILPTVLSTSLGKTFFAWRFILNENLLF